MDEAARTAFLKNYENFMTAKFFDYGSKNHVNFLKILQQQVSAIEKAILNAQAYTPYLFHS